MGYNLNNIILICFICVVQFFVLGDVYVFRQNILIIDEKF